MNPRLGELGEQRELPLVRVESEIEEEVRAVRVLCGVVQNLYVLR